MSRMELLRILIMVFYSNALILCICECGEMITNQFNMFRNELDQTSWYLYPIEMQRMLVIVMANAQQPTIISGFGNAVCVRDSFKKVINCRNCLIKISARSLQFFSSF